MLKIEFNTLNAAFASECEQTCDNEEDDFALRTECERILLKLADAIRGGSDGGAVRDVNGNTVGSWSLIVDTN